MFLGDTNDIYEKTTVRLSEFSSLSVKKWLVFLFCFIPFCSFLAQANVSWLYLSYGEKSKRIVPINNNGALTTKVCFYKPIVEYRLYTLKDKDNITFEIFQKGLYSRNLLLKEYYHRFDSLEKVLSNYLSYNMHEKIGKLVPSSLNYFGEKDSLIIVGELRKLKKILKDSLLREYSINDKLFSILKKHGDQQHILLTVDFYQVSYLNWALYSFYVFDLRTRTLFFYKYLQNVIKNVDVSWLKLKSQDRFMRVFSKYKRYLRKNHRALKRIH